MFVDPLNLILNTQNIDSTKNLDLLLEMYQNKLNNNALRKKLHPWE